MPLERPTSTLFDRPYLNVAAAGQIIERSYPTAAAFMLQLEQVGILKEITGRNRNRIFFYEPYFQLFDDSELGAEEVLPIAPPERTVSG